MSGDSRWRDATDGPFRVHSLILSPDCDPRGGTVAWDPARSLWNAGMMLAAFVLSVWTAGIGAIVGVALAGLFIAYDGFDYPLSRRGASFG